MEWKVQLSDIRGKEILGRGSFGVVYKVLLNNVAYAVKEFFKEDDNAKKGIENEVKYLSRATHENIIKLFDTLQSEDSKTLILMEFADCGSLYDYIHEKGDYSDLDAVDWMKQLASGLEYLHAMKPKPIIHRDIKTKNLLLTNNYRVLKIADFGTVREKATLMTEQIGTAEYMAPEIGQGFKYSEKTDVYSFGIVLWEVISRKKPFYHLENPDPPPLTIMILVSQDKRPPIEDVTDIWNIKTIIKNCWDTNPLKRPSMNDLESELKFIYNNQSIDVTFAKRLYTSSMRNLKRIYILKKIYSSTRCYRQKTSGMLCRNVIENEDKSFHSNSK